jgi:phosphatidate cytidylyltransferase
MNPEARERLFGVWNAFDHPVTLGITVALFVVLAASRLLIWRLAQSRRVSPTLRDELLRRWRSWVVLVPLLLMPVLLGAFWVIVGVGLLSLLCYREFARATGLFREKLVSLIVVLGIVATTLAVLDHWYRLFVALTPLTICLIAVVAVTVDHPAGYIQRVALGILGFVLFGTCMGHLGYLANSNDFRPAIILVVLAVQANDVFAFVCGKLFGRRKLLPHTSPNKTVAGALGATLLTTLLVIGIGLGIYPESTRVAYGISLAKEIRHLATFGMILSVAGQFGDLMISSIKRDLGLKDMGCLLPGHGGLLDRFDSVILAAPAAFHFANYIAGLGLDQPTRIFSGT